MAVIITGMEMPESCGMCEASGTSVCRKWSSLKGYDVGSKRADGCPLKSVDGLIEEIEMVREKEEPYVYDYRYYRNEGLDMALTTLKQYIGDTE